MYLGIDIGTGAIKALLVDDDAAVMAAATVEIPSHLPRPGWHEQDADEVWAGLVRAARQVLGKISPAELRAVGFSSAMHGLMALDQNLAPLTRQLTWADGRAGVQALRLRQESDAAGIYRATGCPLQALYYPAKLAWLREERPEVFRSAAKFCSLKDLMIFRLTGRLLMDRSHASSHGLLNTHTLEWEPQALDLAGIGPERLPELCSPQSVLEGITPAAARELGLPAGVKIVPGAGDGGLANVGSGAVSPGQVAATIGTSGAMRLIADRPLLDPRERTWCYHLTDGAWYAGGAINSGGLVYRWVRDALFPDLTAAARREGLEPYQELNRIAESVPAGARGLIFLPYLMGERTPLWDPHARGVIFGLRPEHTRSHLVRAAMEGVCFGMNGIRKALVAAAGEIREVRVSGGFMRSPLWVQILADVLGHSLAIPVSQEGSAQGAAFLAMRALGRLKDLAEVKALAPVAETVACDSARHEFYEQLYAVFEGIYPQVKSSFERLSALALLEEK